MTPHLTLDRLDSTDVATYGQLFDAQGKQIAVTLEQPWKDNQHDVSCVPVGTYRATRYRSPKRGYDVFVLADVPGRSMVELHVGNTVADTHGCILLGSNLDVVNGQHGITGSRAAFARVMDALRGIEMFTLTIRSVA